MKTEQIISGNKTIGKFVGYNILPSGYGHFGKRTIDFTGIGLSNNPFFHSDFDWLMVAWIKIGEIKSLNNTDSAKIYLEEMEIRSNSALIKGYSLKTSDLKRFISFEVVEDCGEGNEHLTNKSLIECLFKVCVEFINWYEKQ